MDFSPLNILTLNQHLRSFSDNHFLLHPHCSQNIIYNVFPIPIYNYKYFIYIECIYCQEIYYKLFKKE